LLHSGVRSALKFTHIMGNFEFITVKTLSLLGFGGATEILEGGLEPRSPGLAPPLNSVFGDRR